MYIFLFFDFIQPFKVKYFGIQNVEEKLNKLQWRFFLLWNCFIDLECIYLLALLENYINFQKSQHSNEDLILLSIIMEVEVYALIQGNIS